MENKEQRTDEGEHKKTEDEKEKTQKTDER